jgi:predicted nucleic acid-binding protein
MMIIDASVAVPWLIATPFTPAARGLKSQPGRAPSLILIETTNSLLKYFRTGQITEADIEYAINSLSVALDEIVDDGTLLQAATRIAASNSHNIYDCLYLALALDRHEPLATADRRLASLARSLNIETQLIGPEP